MDTTQRLLEHARQVQEYLAHLDRRIRALESPRAGAARWRGGACSGCSHSITQHLQGDQPPQIVCTLTHDRWVCGDPKLSPPEACSARQDRTSALDTPEA